MKKIKQIFIILILFCVCLTTVSADVTIGAGPGGGHYASGVWRNLVYIPYGGPAVNQYRGYKIRLVYYDGSDAARTRGESAWQEITSFDVVVSNPTFERTNYANLVRLHAQNNTRLGLLSGPNVTWLGQQIAGVENGTTNETAIRSALEANDSARLKAIIQELGVDESQMSKESEEEMKANAKGYRFVAEKLIVLANKGWLFANSRKEMAQVLSEGNSGFPSGLWNLSTTSTGAGKYPGDIHTTRDDINVRSVGAGWTYGNFKSYNIGAGLGIISIGKNPYSDHDYSYTAACATCENTNSDYLAYTIKDTSDWGGIMASGSSKFENVQGYFHDGSYPSGDGQDPSGDVYCREEFSVYFPNQLSQIYVEPGRYFVLNPEESELAGLNEVGASAIPNLKPYKVYRKRECRAEVNLTQYEDETYSAFQARLLAAKRTTLSNYETAKKEDFAGDMGKVWFRYTETYEESKYNMDEPDEMQLYDVYESNPLTDYGSELASIAADDAQLTMENTTKYKLPEEYYRYVRLRDGLSMSKVPSEPYKEVGIANLPVSFENHGVKISATQYKAADIQFAYDLPDNAMLKKAASNNGYLATTKGDGGSGGNCIAKSTIEGEPTDGYSCKILTSTIPNTPDEPGDPDNPDDGCNTPQDAEDLGLDWNDKHGYCCPVGTTYDEDTGDCEDDSGDPDEPGDPGDSCKTEEDASRLGVDWNPMTRSCCAKGTTYNPEKGKCVPGDDNTTDPVCPTDCEYGCCPSGECAPMPTINGEPFCPGLGGIDVIYRTIDLEDPFPGQNAESRETGANWCSYNIRTQEIDCKYNNNTVKNYITRERNNKKNGYKVYDDDHILYEVNLDSKTISSIRRYNDKNKYDDDWISECYDNGKACKSKFLREYSSVITGKCKSTSSSNFYTCDKDV